MCSKYRNIWGSIRKWKKRPTKEHPPENPHSACPPSDPRSRRGFVTLLGCCLPMMNDFFFLLSLTACLTLTGASSSYLLESLYTSNSCGGTLLYQIGYQCDACIPVPSSSTSVKFSCDTGECIVDFLTVFSDKFSHCH